MDAAYLRAFATAEFSVLFSVFAGKYVIVAMILLMFSREGAGSSMKFNTILPAIIRRQKFSSDARVTIRDAKIVAKFRWVDFSHP